MTELKGIMGRTRLLLSSNKGPVIAARYLPSGQVRLGSIVFLSNRRCWHRLCIAQEVSPPKKINIYDCHHQLINLIFLGRCPFYCSFMMSIGFTTRNELLW